MRRQEAKQRNMKLFRVHAESVQLPFILVWAKHREEALDWAKQEPIDNWYEHETKPHFVQEHKAELIENVNSHVSRNRNVPSVWGEYE